MPFVFHLGNSQVSVYRTIGPTLVFCFGQIRTLVSMTTLSNYHGKSGNWQLLLFHWSYFKFLFTEMFIE